MFKMGFWLFFLSLMVMSFQSWADISGTVFKDADADGVADPAEVGLPGVVISAFDDMGVLISQTASCGNFAVAIPADPPTIPVAINIPACTLSNYGQYTLTGLTAATEYRIEALFTDPMMFSTANGVDSVSFATDGDTNVRFGANYPEDYCQNNPRIIAGCYVLDLTQPTLSTPYDPTSTEPLIVSWPYDTRFTTATNSQVHTGSFDYDADYGDFGHIFSVAVHRPTLQSFFSGIASPQWDFGPNGIGGIYTADYSGPGDSFVAGSTTLFVDLAPFTDLTNQSPITAGMLDRFGEQGLGGLAITDDGTTMWAINMGARSLLEINIGNPAVAPGAADISEVAITGAGCVGGVFRPGAVALHRGNVYIGGICDASTSTIANLRAVVLEYDGTTFTSRMSEVLDFNVNQIFPEPSFQMAPWSSATNALAPQPAMTDLVFDDNDGIVIGIMPRIVYNGFSQTAGIILRADPDGAGNFVLENAGSSGPYNTAADTTWAGSGFTSANPEPLNEGPGDDYFFENGIYSGAFSPPPFSPPGSATYHPVLFSAGITVVPGTGEVAAGYTDPLSINTFGVRYLDRTDGQTVAGLQFGGFKVALVSDVAAICHNAPLEIGNRLWCDTDSDGVQDPGENGANGVAVSFQCGADNVVTVNTAGDGNYVFTDALYAAANGGAQIPRGTSCTVSIPTTGVNGVALVSQCNGNVSSPINNGGLDDNADLRDSDGVINGAGTAVEIAVTTGGSGNNNHALDQGFIGVLTDLGDNPDPNYPTLLVSNGAVHNVSAGLFLGACVDTEVDGMPNPMAAGDDSAVGISTLGICATAGDDEDGVTDFQNLIVGNTTASLDVTSTGTCQLDAWIDFNQNGSFADSDEQIFNSLPLVNGLNDDLIFSIPASASLGDTYSRFRCSSGGGLTASGAAPDGEVEDYLLNIAGLNLGDFVWYDTNQDGLQNNNEPGLNGVTVNLYDNATCTGMVADTTTTMNGGMPAADGFYQFTDLSPQIYCVEFTDLPAGYQFTMQNVGGDDSINSDADQLTGQVQNINLTSNDQTIDAGVFLNGSVAGLTWCESSNNANTTYDPGDGDTVLTDIGVTLYQDLDCSNTVNGTEPGTAVTQDTNNPAGTYLFNNLPVGPAGNSICYIAEVDAADADLGICDTLLTPLTLGPDLDTLNPNSVGNDFGFDDLLSLGDFVWYDTNQNGLQDGGEPGVNGITVNLYNNATCTGLAVDSMVTANGGTPANDGYYFFMGLDPADYCIEFAGLPAGYQFTMPNIGGNDLIDSDANVATGQVQNINLTVSNPTIDAGVFLNGSVAGLAWCESASNANATYDPGDGDTVLADIGITLYQDLDCSNTVNGSEGGTAVSQDTTNPAGTYLFSNLPVGPAGNAICYITEVDATDPDLGVCDTGITPLTLGPDLDVLTPDSVDNNFGFDDLLSLGDYVWYDNNQNGVQDIGEPGVNGVTVDLYDNATCSGVSVDSMTTAIGGTPAVDGFYSFTNLDPGSYCIEFSGLPASYVFTNQNVGGDDGIDSDADSITGQVQNINLAAVDPTIDAGVYASNGQVSGLLYCDSMPENGMLDAGEEIGGINVTLARDLGCDGTPDITIGTLGTDGSGAFLFDNLPVALAPAPPNPLACYLLSYDVSNPGLSECNVPVTPVTQVVTIDTNDPTDDSVTFVVIVGGPPAQVPFGSKSMLLILAWLMVLVAWRRYKYI